MAQYLCENKAFSKDKLKNKYQIEFLHDKEMQIAMKTVHN